VNVLTVDVVNVDIVVFWHCTIKR